MKLPAIVSVLAIMAGLLPASLPASPAEAQVLTGRSAPSARRAPPPRQYALSVDEEYDLTDAREQITVLDGQIAELQAQQTAGTLTEEGREQWRALYEQRQTYQTTVDVLTAKRNAASN